MRHSFLNAVAFEGPVPLDEVAHKQILGSVVIEVEEHGGGVQTLAIEARRSGNIGEGAVTIIPIKNVTTVVSNEQVDPTVAIVICGGDADAEVAAGYAGFDSDIGKSAVAVVAIESVAQRRDGFEKIGRAAIDEIEVHPPIVVVVENRDTGPHGFRQVPAAGFGVIVYEKNTRAREIHRHKNRRGRCESEGEKKNRFHLSFSPCIGQ